MAQQLLLPDPGEGIHEAEILEIAVSAGDEVAEDDLLFEVETDKAVTQIPAPFTGRVVDIAVSVGDILEVGQVLLSYETAGDTDSDPVAAPAPDPGNGETGALPTRPSTPEPVRALQPVPASPATRALARRLGVDLHDIDGTGPDGRIEPDDVKAAADTGTRVAETAAATAVSGAAKEERWGPVEREPLRGVRRATAHRMETAWREIPHVTHQDVADITELEQYRAVHADAVADSGGKLTLTVFLVKAAVAALRKYPRFNASLEDDELITKRYINIGVAVDTPDGLVVPVLREPDRKTAVEIAEELVSLSARMRRGDRESGDFSGGTFTITNPGGIGGTSFSPIINHPEVAILGAARARWVPAVADDGGAGAAIAPRLQLPLVLAFDHRVNDGADAARFLRTIVESLENVTRLLLGL